MYQYTAGNNAIIRLEDGAIIPLDNANSDYIKVAAWVAEGNVIAEADPLPMPPIVLTRRQFFIALNVNGYLTEQEAAQSAIPASVLAYFETLPAPQKSAAIITWYQMTQVAQDDPMVEALANILGMSEQQIQDFFVAAQSF